MCLFVSYFLVTVAAQFIITYLFLTITANPYVLQLNQRLNVLLTSSILSIVFGICAVLLAFFIIWFLTMWGRRSRENERDDSDSKDDNPGNQGNQVHLLTHDHNNNNEYIQYPDCIINGREDRHFDDMPQDKAKIMMTKFCVR